MSPSGRRVFYTDGSVRNNGSPKAKGGYGWVETNETETEVIHTYKNNRDPSGQVPTNNRMELLAVITALHNCNQGDLVTIKSDSAYIVNCINNHWYEDWIAKGKTSTGSLPKNMDLWQKLKRQIARVGSGVAFVHVKGHSTNEMNKLADRLAGEAMRLNQNEEGGDE